MVVQLALFSMENLCRRPKTRFEVVKKFGADADEFFFYCGQHFCSGLLRSGGSKIFKLLAQLPQPSSSQIAAASL